MSTTPPPAAPKPGQPTVNGSSVSVIASPSPYGEQPPRLCAGINDSLTDASPTAKFAPSAKPIPGPKPKKGEKAEPQFAAEQSVPVTDTVDATTPAAVTKILDWVSGRIDKPLDDAWKSQVSQTTLWAPTGGPEEDWAKAFTEAFLGITYAGVGQTYQIDPRNPDKFQPMMFRRIEKKLRRRAADVTCVQSWDNLVPLTADADCDNDDPAIPIGAACQHATTYGVLTRGFTLDSMGNASNPAVGLAASIATWDMPLFGGQGYDKPLGSTAPLAGIHLPKPIPPPPKGSPPPDPTPESLNSHWIDLGNAIPGGFGPGSIVVYDPNRRAATAPSLYMNPYELAKYGPDATAVYGKYFKSRDSDNDGAGFTNKAWENKDRPATESATEIKAQQDRLDTVNKRIADRQLQGLKPKATDTQEQTIFQNLLKKAQDNLAAHPDTTSREELKYPGPRQYDGCHIWFCLRKHPTKPLIQTFDVSARDSPGQLAETKSDSIFAMQGEGVADGSKSTRIYDLNNAFTGIGVLPSHTVGADQVNLLKAARPVGLMRLAITKVVKGQVSPTDVLYVSRLTRMYGNSSTQNYWVSKLLWSVRNLPGFSTVRAWWIVYAPRGRLANAMWAYKARSMTLTQYCAKYGDIGAQDLLLDIVLSTYSDGPRAGHAGFFSRFKSSPKGATTVTSFEPPPGPPSAIMHHVNPAMMGVNPPMRSLKWNEMYSDPKLKVDDSSFAIFKDGQ
jgi:hypothetical protein